MTELIRVDFKKGKIESRRDLEKPIPQWKAAKDPDFKGFVEGFALACEMAHASGGDWRRAIIVVQDSPPGEDDYCFVVWDNTTIDHESVCASLELAMTKVVVDQQVEDKNEPL